MTRNKTKKSGWFAKYLRETFLNKIIALLIILVSSVPIWIKGDPTILLLMSIFAVPLFLTNKNWIYKD